MALRSPTAFHSYWGAYPTGSLPTSSSVQVGDTAFDTTLGVLKVCTAIGPVAWSNAGASGVAAYGSWSNTLTIPVGATPASTVPTIATFDTEDVPPVGLSLVGGPGGSQLRVATSGTYEFTCSPQVHVAGGQSSIVTFWVRKNGGNLPNSASSVEVGNNSRFALPFVAYVIAMAANDTVEFLFHGDGDSPMLYGLGAQIGPPQIPAEPSIIVTAKKLA